MKKLYKTITFIAVVIFTSSFINVSAQLSGSCYRVENQKADNEITYYLATVADTLEGSDFTAATWGVPNGDVILSGDTTIWKLEDAGGGYFSFESCLVPGLYLTTDTSQHPEATPSYACQLKPDKTDNGSKWKFVENGDSYNLENRKTMDVDDKFLHGSAPNESTGSRSVRIDHYAGPRSQWLYYEVACPVVSSLSNIEEPTINVSSFPNPAVDNICFAYALENSSKVNLKLIDIQGRTVATLISGLTQIVGVYSKEFNISFLQEGVYFYVMEVNGTVQSEKVIIQR